MENEFHVGDVIELLPEFQDLYTKAKSGHKAVIKDKKESDGFQMIYVSWIGETEIPGWTFSNHFKFIRSTEELLPRIRAKAENMDSEEEYMDKVFRAIDAACDSEAFFILAMKTTQTPQGKIIAPELYCLSQNETAAFMMEAQIMTIASDMFRNVVAEAIQQQYGYGDS